MILNSSIDSSVGVDSSVMFDPTSTFDTPSTSQFTALRRDPLIEMLTVLVRPMPDLVREVARHAGRQRRQLHEVAVVERQLLDLPRVHEVLHRGRRLHELRFRRHLDGLGHAGDLEPGADLLPVVHVQLHARDDRMLEAREPERELVVAHGQQRGRIDAGWTR